MRDSDPRNDSFWARHAGRFLLSLYGANPVLDCL
jgi:hypothetical protein